ncbi:EAL domain-containing protein [bacterium]|nr:EAL domain-containing protein [bacterium]
MDEMIVEGITKNSSIEAFSGSVVFKSLSFFDFNSRLGMLANIENLFTDSKFLYVFISLILLIIALIAVVIFISVKLAAQNKIFKQSIYDKLTGIYNYPYFVQKVERRLKEEPETEFMIVTFNVARFRLINEYYGKAAGDKLLIYIAGNLRFFDQYDQVTYGRIGDDKFVLFLPYSESAINKIAERSKELSANYNINFKIDPYMGVYIIKDRNLEIRSMVDRAIMASKTIRGQYNKVCAVFEVDMLQKVTIEQEIIGEMEKAIENKEFIVYYQPKYNLHTNNVVGAEALVRWLHPVKGVIAPGKFIPVFENNGFITQLDNYVWEEVCIFLRKSIDSGAITRPVSVNVSRVNLYDPEIAAKINRLVGKYNIPPKLLELEITESAYSSDNDNLLKVLRELQEYGFNILMDDFGSGYSSLNMLKDFPINILKIDMRFLANVEGASNGKSRNIIASVVRMSKWLNIPVIAEGVETKEQVEFLRSIGCEMAQGYYYAKPMTENEYVSVAKKYKDVEVSEEMSAEAQVKIAELWEMNGAINDLFNTTTNALAIVEIYNENIEVIKCNDQYFEIMKTSRSKYFESENRKVLTKVLKEDKAGLEKLIKKAVALKKPVKGEYRRYAYDGSIIWLEISFMFIAKKDDRLLLYAAINDITKYKKAEQKFMDEKRKYQILIETLKSSS